MSNDDFYKRLDFALTHGVTEAQVFRMLEMGLIEVTPCLGGEVMNFAGGLSRDQAVQTFVAICRSEIAAAQNEFRSEDDAADDDSELTSANLYSCPTIWA
jgi:hypothetical protein